MSESVLILPQYSLPSPVAKDGKSLVDNTPYYSRTKSLIELLEDVGVIYFDSTTNMYGYKPFIQAQQESIPNKMIGKMLGYTAEGIVVRECNNDPTKNVKWANLARFWREDTRDVFSWVKKIFWYPLLKNPNNYHAIGTGFAKTKKNNPEFFDSQSDRDICWIDNARKAKELLIPKNIINSKRKNAGIQIKVSFSSNGSYVTNYFKRKPYFNLYPVVYFDLGNDFNKVRNKLLNLCPDVVKENSLFSQNVEFSEGLSKYDVVEMMLIRGRDIEPSLHDELLYYKSIFERLVSNGLSLFELTDDKVIFGLIADFLGNSVIRDSSILTIAYDR